MSATLYDFAFVSTLENFYQKENDQNQEAISELIISAIFEGK